MFSSPAAFLRTLSQHVETVTNPRRRGGPPPSVRVLAKAQDNVEQDFGDEDELEETWEDALATAGRLSARLTAEERKMLDDMRAWAQRAVDRGDTKLDVLVEWLDGIMRPDGDWNDERVIIFTEYRDTQVWLQQHLAARGLGGDRLALLYGGMDSDTRERVKAEFQADPSLSPMRILLATDAASEGIDLQRHCHRLLHVEKYGRWAKRDGNYFSSSTRS